MTPSPQLESTASAPPTAGYRPEIQGLRALAATLVAVYHIWFDRVAGAIDVFFVVSGFLITGLLVRRLETEGRIRPGAYLTRIARRIFPAAYLVLGGILVASALWLSPVAWYGTLGDIRSAALYVANWDFAFGAVDYFAADAAQNPVLHYWALSVQGQFYLTWPLLIGAVALVARRLHRDLRRSILAVLVVVFAASFTFGMYSTAKNQPFAYFSTLARAWEFALGGIIAVRFSATNLPGRVRLLAGWLGLALIVGTGAVVDGRSLFPGLITLSPTLATCLILVAGATGARSGALVFLSSRPMVWLGDISYSLFLWHWPVLVFMHLRVGARPLTVLEGSVVLAVSAVLATITTRLIETPFRRESHPITRGRYAWAFGLVPVAMIAGLTVLGRAPASASSFEPEAYPGPRVFTPGFVAAGSSDVPLRPALTAARDDFPADGGRACFQRARDDTVLRCVFGVPTSGVTIALVGGSHSRHWLPALEAIAAEHDIRIVTFLKATCRFQLPADTASCTHWNEQVIDILLSDPPDAVFTTATVAALDREEYVPDGFLTQWRSLSAAGIPVLGIRDNPRFPFDPPECVAARGPDACQLARDAVLAPVNPADAIDGRPDTVFPIDLTAWLCHPEVCPVVAGNLLIYRDDDHLTATYAAALAPYLEQEIRRVLPSLFAGSSSPDPGVLPDPGA